MFKFENAFTNNNPLFDKIMVT